MAGLNNALISGIGLILAILLLLILTLAGLVVRLWVRLRRTEARYRALATGTSGNNLEEILEAHVSEVRQAVGRVSELDTTVRGLERAGQGHIQHLGFLRYNPFRDTGGDQSFVLALADADGNGAVISSLHGRDATRIYAKPLAAWESSYQLTEEERQAISRAKED